MRFFNYSIYLFRYSYEFNREPREIRGRARRCNPFFFRFLPEKGTLLALMCHCSNMDGKAAKRAGKSEDLPLQTLKAFEDIRCQMILRIKRGRSRIDGFRSGFFLS